MASDKDKKMSGISRKTYLRDVNPYLICPLCRGYLIDATTVVECLHSFCRSCILKHLQKEAQCPSCKDVLNKAKPNIKADKALQDIVYKLVPGLYHKEMRRRKEFYMKHPEHAESATPEQRGEDAASSRLFFAPEDAVSLSLEYLPPGVDPIDADNINNGTESKSSNGGSNRRYLQCPALVTIAHLKKFLALKYNVDITRYNIDICHRRAPLPEYLTLMDVAYIYAWKRNAPMRFFYIITREEQQLEAPPNDRPSTPGLGASFPPDDNRQIITPNNNEMATENVNVNNANSNVNKIVEQTKKIEQSVVKEPKGKLFEKAKEKLPGTDKNAKKEEREEKLTKEQPAKVKLLKEKAMNESLVNKIKSPIKILKNSDGSYEVKSSTNNTSQSNAENSMSTSTESKAEKTEFSIVSINNGSNSNGVKMTLKQCPPGNNVSSKKPKIISNVLLRSPDEKSSASIIQQFKNANANLSPYKSENPSLADMKNKEPNEVTEKVGKMKRKVSFCNETLEPESKKMKISDEQKTKKEFLQSFELTATEDCKSRPSNSPEGKASIKSAKKDETSESSSSISKTKEVESKSESKKNANSPTKASSPSTSSKNLDVYTFPSESPPITGAVKRKCPPGLMITDVSKKSSSNPQDQRKVKPNLINTPKSYRKMMKDSKSSAATSQSQLPSPSQQSTASQSKSPMSIVDTRNLLDECGLNIPAGLSITIATSKPSATFSFPSDNTTTMKLAVKSVNKINQSLPNEFAKSKGNFAKSPAPDIIPISNQDITKGRNFKPRQESQDALDLSNNRSPEFATPRVHRLPKVPLPVIKPRTANQNLSKKGQVVTLNGGQKYYRAPPGSLTPAAHRVTEFSAPSSGRGPVYAPNLLGSSSNNLSSAFPTLQSFFVQYQRDRFKCPPQENPTKTHLMAQCPPAKPARSSLVVPKQSPSNGHLYIKKVLANDSRMANTKNVTFERPSQTPTTTDSSVSAQKDTSSSNVERSAASPRVSSTVSPSPPPPTIQSNNEANSQTSESKENNDQSPESPDSSSVIENKAADKKDKAEQEKKEQKQMEEDFQKRLLAAFPSKEWINNSVSQEHLDNLIKNLKCRVENKESDKLSKQTEETKECEEGAVDKKDAS